jgi:hypothetical protein
MTAKSPVRLSWSEDQFMQPAAIGIRPHSGWAAVVVAAGDPAAIEVIDRRRIAITSPEIPGASQPYHFAAEAFVRNQSLPDAERYLARCAVASEQLALTALQAVVSEDRGRETKITGCAILLAAGHALPALEQILASHSLIHTAEGEFFRRCLRTAGERLGLRVSGMRERDLDRCALAAFGPKANPLKRKIAGLGRTLGPPWTADQKNACLAALLAVAGL